MLRTSVSCSSEALAWVARLGGWARGGDAVGIRGGLVARSINECIGIIGACLRWGHRRDERYGIGCAAEPSLAGGVDVLVDGAFESADPLLVEEARARVAELESAGVSRGG